MKLILKLLAGVLLLVVLALGGLLVLIDPNDFKPELQQLAREQGQVELKLAGDIGWSLYPSIALSLPALELLTLEGQPLASLQRAEVSVKVLPLLSGQLQMKGLLLDGLQLDWTVPVESATDSGGGSRGNSGAVAGEPVSSAPAVEPRAETAAPTFDIGSVELTNARIRYADPASARVVELRDLNVSAERLLSGVLFPASLWFELALFQGEGTQPQLVAATQLQVQLLVDLAQQRFEATNLQLDVLLSGAALADAGLAEPIDVHLGAGLMLDQAQNRAEISGLRLELSNLALTADLQVDAVSAQPQIEGQLQLATFDLKQLLTGLGLPALETTDDAVLRQIALRSELQGSVESIALESLQLTLDQSQIDGRLAYSQVSGGQTISLALDAIDLDRYLPPPAEDKAKQGAAATNESASTPPAGRYSKAPLLPVELLRALNVEADLNVGALTAAGVSMQQVRVLVSAHNGLVQLKQVSGQLYQGRFSNSATLDARRKPLLLSANKSISDIELGALLQDLAELDRFSGRLSMQGQYQAQGNSVYDFVHSLNGELQLGLKQGRLKGVDLGDTLCRGILKLKGQASPPQTEQAYTEFSNLSATAKITDGVLVNRDLKAALTGIDLAGDGQVDLPDESLDYGLELAVLQQFASDNCRIDQRLHNLALPLRCQGGFDTEPATLCGVDSRRIKQVISKAASQDAKQKLKNKLEDKLKENDSVKGLLKGLFK